MNLFVIKGNLSANLGAISKVFVLCNFIHPLDEYSQHFDQLYHPTAVENIYLDKDFTDKSWDNLITCCIAMMLVGSFYLLNMLLLPILIYFTC